MKRLLTILLMLALAGAVVACDDDDDANNTNNSVLCGNGTIDGSEECDGTDFGGKTCGDFDAYTEGTLSCSEDCHVMTDECHPMIKSVTIIGTTDMHSHLFGVGPVRYYTPLDTSDNDPVTGGLARIATVIKDIKAEAKDNGIPTITVDSGDYLMGDMVDLLSGSMPPVYRFFMALGYDGITLGNHEFDWTPTGLATVINAAKNNLQFNVPILLSNMVFDATDPSDDDLQALLDNGLIKPYTIKALDDDFAVGIFGHMGYQADLFVPQAAPVTFWHPDPEDAQHGWDQLQKFVDDMHAAGAQMVMQAGHVGIEARGVGEDRDWAANLHGLHVIFSGHRHQLLDDTMLNVGDTYIIATSQYGTYVSRMDLQFNLKDEEVKDATGMVIAINDSIQGDTEIQSMLDQSVGILDNVLYQNMGITYSATPVADTNFNLWMYDAYTTIPVGDDVEFPLGNYIADAQRMIMNGFIQQIVSDATDPAFFQVFDASPIEVAFIEGGAVRDPIYPALGDGTSSEVAGDDVFKAFPLGIGPDGIPGYPMLTFYVTKKELKTILDLDVESILGNVPFEYYLHPAGIRYVWDETRPQFDKVVAAFQCPLDNYFTTKDCLLNGTPVDLTDDSTAPGHMVRIAVDYYVALMLPQARNEYGANLTIDPKDKNGNVLDFNDFAQIASRVFDLDPTDGTEITELKAWTALMVFTQSLPDCYMTQDASGNIVPHPALYGGEACNGLPSFPRKVYDKFQTPATVQDVAGGQATQGDLFWQWGIRRNMTIGEYCTTLDHLGSFLPDTPLTAAQINPVLCGNGNKSSIRPTFRLRMDPNRIYSAMKNNLSRIIKKYYFR